MALKALLFVWWLIRLVIFLIVLACVFIVATFLGIDLIGWLIEKFFETLEIIKK